MNKFFFDLQLVGIWYKYFVLKNWFGFIGVVNYVVVS